MALNLNKGSKIGKFYYQKDGITFGPITLDELLEIIDADTMVFYEGASWSKAKDQPELSKFFKLQNTNSIESPSNSKSQVNSIENIPVSQQINDSRSITDSPINEVVDELPEPPKKNTQVATALGLLFLSFLIIGYFLWYKPYLRDKNAARMYSYATSLALRSSAVSGVDYNTIGNILYGSEVLVYENSGEWSQCKANNQEGFAASKFLLSKEEFHILNGIFADQDSRDAVVTTKCKKALLDYYNSRNYMGKIDEQLQLDIYDSVLHREVWQIFARNKNFKTNAVAYPRVVNPNSKFTDFACLITNVQTKKRKLLLFSFNETEDATLEFEQDAPDYGYIERIYKKSSPEYSNYYVTYTN